MDEEVRNDLKLILEKNILTIKDKVGVPSSIVDTSSCLYFF